MSREHAMTRRKFLQASAVGGVSLLGASVLAACGVDQPTPVPSKPAPAAVPTAVPPVPTQATGTKIGANLVGKLGGPEIITDPAKFPKKFNEAPDLAALVKAGKLPAVQERIGEEPLVMKPFGEIGKYGGTLRRAFTGPADQYSGRRMAGIDTLLWWDYTGLEIVPNIAKSWKLADDGLSLTLNLRKGIKWSDGHPFTSEDIIFWFEDMYLNKELIPTPAVEMTINSKPVTVEKVDDYTVKYKFPEPYYYFLEQLACNRPSMGGQSVRGLEATGGYAPAHYNKLFHPKYVAKDKLDQIVKDAKFDNWVKLFKFKNDWTLNPDLPVLTPWKTVSPINTPTWTLERNVYSFWVDTEGNQLPYIDKIVLTLAENLEVVNLRAIAGEYDIQERHIDLSKLPVFLENRTKGNYRVELDPADYGTDAGMYVNMAYDADPEIAKWLTNVDFRRALSLGVERNQLNETFWLGIGTPGSPVPDEANPYCPGPEYRTLWHTYDTKKANELLDKIGLDKKDADGYRLRTDGKGRLRIELMTFGGQFMPYTQMGEMIAQRWKQIGVDLMVKEVERSLGLTRNQANEQQLFMWNNDTSSNLLDDNKTVPTVPGGWSIVGEPFATWFATDGAKGKEPGDRLLHEALDKYRKMAGVPKAERLKLGREIWATSVDQVWCIGTVGLSPAVSGVRITKNTLGNVAQRTVNSVVMRTPGLMRPATFYWKT